MVSIEGILGEVGQLNEKDQVMLLEQLTQIIKTNKQNTKKTTLDSIKGIGADIWKGVDIDQYVANEREW